uniref:DDE-1 domain-containing protein n=1 Tax=Anolis carolinensis TaxID=28377 RepID=H9GSD8_ANOCA
MMSPKRLAMVCGSKPKCKLYATVGCHYGINESTVCYIKKEEKNIRSTATVSFKKTAKWVITLRNKLIVKMESNEAGPSTSTGFPTTSGFAASKGWFHKCQKRYGLKSISLHGEAASADTSAAEEYVSNTFKDIIKEGAIYQNKMPSRTFVMKEESKAPGFKAQKDRPGLIYKSKNPRAIKNKNNNVLPLHWMHDPKAWIMKILTKDWFHQVKVYLAQKGLEFEILLLIDNAGGHAIDITHDGIQVEFLPPNTTSLIQPMDQGIIRTFKVLYTSNSLQNLIEAMDIQEDVSLKMYWHDHMIASCLKNIQKAITEMKTETLNACWKKLWLEVAHDHKGLSLDEIHHSEVNKAVRLAKILGGESFSDMTAKDVNDLLDVHGQPLTDEDLEELEPEESLQRLKIIYSVYCIFFPKKLNLKKNIFIKIFLVLVLERGEGGKGGRKGGGG